jgi:hypothetical protein
MAEVPLDQVLATAEAPLVRERNDVFMVSYLDYRRLPDTAVARSAVDGFLGAWTGRLQAVGGRCSAPELTATTSDRSVGRASAP